MKQKKKRRKVQAILMILVMLMSVSVLQGVSGKRLLSARAAGESVTRGEWIHNLVSTFDMKMEEGLVPDTYYPDIVGTTYYSDIQTAIYFGVVDLEAGESFEPDAAVDREFAAHTLSFCMGYDTSDVTYTMDDEADLTYPGDDQTAVDMGWLALQDGKFAPSQEITTTESQNMLQSAKKVLDASGVDENHENVYKFADNVIELPESVTFDKGEDGQIIVHDTSVELKEGDVFAVYSDGIAYTYKALSITKEGNDLIINNEKVMYDDAVESVDAEGVIDADLADFIPAEGVEAEVEYEDQTTVKGMHKISGVKSVKSINVSKSIGAGTVTCSISDITVDYRIDKNGYRFAVYGKVDPSFTFSGKKDLVITLGTIPVAQVGKIEVKAVCSAKGSATVGFTTNAVVGVEQKVGHAPRHLANYTSPQWRFSAKAELKAACDLSFSVEVPMAAEGKVYGEVGVKTTPDMEVYTDGKKPQVCIDLPVYVFAEAGYSVKVFGYDMASGKKPIYDASNSPVKLCYHIEDGNCVPACTRPDSSSRVGKRGYYTSPSLQSGVGNTYGSQVFVAPYVEKKVFEYTLDDDGNATITKYDGNVRALTIPDTLDGYTVVGIGKNAFAKNTYLQSVVIPDTVTVIQESAFAECTNLSSVVLSENLVDLGRAAFSEIALTAIEIPKSLETAHVSFDNGRDCSDGPFENCEKLKIVTFEKGTTHIAQFLFAGCTGLETISVPNTVTTIERYAFRKCVNLKRVELADTIISIATGAFADCTVLSDINMPKSLKDIGEIAFRNTAITSVEIPKSLETAHVLFDNGRDCSDGPFENCEKLKIVTFEKGTTHIAQFLFAGCTGIESIQIPQTVVMIKQGGFKNCVNLQNIIMPDVIQQVDNYAFKDCTKLDKIHIPDNIKKISKELFQDCTALKEIVLSDNITSIEDEAFENCTSLTKVTVGNKVSSIGRDVFSGCTALPQITLPASVQTIGDKAFSHCEALADVKLSEGLTSIGSYAFEYNIALPKVTLPNTLESLGERAFQYCDVLADVDLGAGLKVIPKYCFYEDPALQKVILPYQFTTVNASAFANCTKLTDITFNRNVSSVDASALSYKDKTTIHGVKGTYAETFASDNGFKFEALNAPVTGITLSKEKIEIAKDKSIRLTASLTPVDTSDELTWTSSNEEVATVEDGVVKAVGLGEAEIVAMAGSVTKSCPVKVYQGVNNITLDVTSHTMTIGDFLQLTATIYPKDAEYKDVIWSSNNEDVAVVDQKGLVQAKAYGKVKITATSKDGGLEAVCNVTVEPVAVTEVSLNAKAVTLKVGETYQLKETILPENATDKTVTWTSSNTKAATVSGGAVTAVGTGSAVIIVKTNSGAKTASCTVTVQGSLPSEGPSVPPTGEPSGSPVVPPTGSPIVSASAKPTGTPSEPVSTTKVTMSMGYAGSDWGDSTFGKTGDSVIVSGDKTYKISYTVKGSDSDILVLSLDTDVTEEEKNPDMNIQVDEITVNGTPITFDPDKISYTIDENGQWRLQFRDAYSGLERSQEALGDEIIPISKGDEICITFTVTGLGKCPEGDDPTASPKPTLKPTTKPDTDPTTSPKATDTPAPSDSAKPSDAPAPSTQPTGTPAPDASRQPSGSGSGFGSTGSGGSLGDSDYLLGTAITSLSNKKGRKLTVRWFRDSNAKGYEVQYATNSKFTKNKKKKMVYRNTGSVTLKKLKKKKTYYVRVRSYNVTGDGKIVYSGWSTKRKIKIKR
ncbi:leucine-rich repeat protein [Jutongia huaianensis]|uniref:Leucine-rich repeat protein n=1 Tax=Jutongia huaianensis TaxID=2763668 RepID=A0ABR7MYM6_9FIRM|nr:leucine-rich repeat protein [Jutongia huaianensis]MBC8561354.1 leucine-rich repeat protein [Jutongia huaianensis]